MQEPNRRNTFFDQLVGRSNLVWMGQNTTHLEPPREVLAAISESIGRREFQIYAPPLGLEQLRELIALDLGLPGCEVIVTDGAVSGLYHICKQLGGGISELVTTDPGWPWPEQFLAAVGKPARLIDVYDAAVGYKLTVANLRKDLKPGSLIYLIDPLNPLGSSYSADELKQICAVARDARCMLVHDCTYRHFARNPTLAAHYYPEGTLTTYSFSKWLGLAGFRIGAIAAPPALAAKLASAPPNSLGSNIVAQRAAIAGLKVRRQWVEHLRTVNWANQEIVVAAMREAGLGQPVVYPSDGNFFAVDISSTSWTGDALAAAFLTHDVFIRSGTYQSKASGQRFVKISTAVPTEWANRCANAARKVIRSR
jgi:aspartate/methionine/tyrosine aminotransferase